MNVPTIKYVPFDRIENTIRPFLPKILIKRLKNKYNQIIQTTRQDDDFVLCHMGLKGPNSVVDDAGQLCGVFDFGNAGIYERWCDLAVICTSKNRRLMNRVLRKYSQYSGVKINKKRINDMILMEAFWAKRWRLENNGEYTCGNNWQTAKTCARCLSGMYGIPYLMRKIILMPLICLYAHMYKKTVHV
ncbi:MAG: aminoglycoside phosphotransferase family protein [Alphaproteobacteria bacterium]|nr:aminoglycoside phosphotransferase family protein [Alphaproteobacteria bacterium]